MRARNQLSPTDELPALLKRYPWIAISVSGTLAGALYSAAAHHPLTQPVVIPSSAFDAAVPFMPWMAWPYATYLLLLPALVLLA